MKIIYYILSPNRGASLNLIFALTSRAKSSIIYSKVGIENGAKSANVGSDFMWEKRGKSETDYRVEARHGKAFEGLLKRYFS